MVEDWRAQAAARRKGIGSVWFWCAVLGGVVGVAVGVAWAIDNPTARAALLVFAALAAAVGLVIGTAVYMRRVDELERDANLWGAYAAITLYLVLFGVERTSRAFGMRVAFADEGIFFLVMTAFIAVYLWKRYR